MSHRCPVPTCRTAVHDCYLMCSRHWPRVSRQTRKRVYRHYKPGQSMATATQPYLDAMAKAVDEATA